MAALLPFVIRPHCGTHVAHRQPMMWKMRAMTPRVAAKLLRESLRDWWRDDGPHMGAALAFYAMLSLAPLLFLVLSGLGAVIGHDTAHGQVVGQIRELIGPQGADAVKAMVRSAEQATERGGWALTLGMCMLFIGSVATFAELQDMLNRIWRVERKPYRHLLHMVQRRMFSFGLVLGFGFLLLVSLMINAVLAATREKLAGSVPGMGTIMHTVHFCVSVGVVTILFGLMFSCPMRPCHGAMCGWAPFSPPHFSPWVNFSSGSTSVIVFSLQCMGRRGRSLCCCYGCTFRRSCFSSGPSSPMHTPGTTFRRKSQPYQV